MHFFRFFTLICLFATFSLQSTLANAFDGYINVENETGYDIHYLYISPANADDWEEDVLEEDILENGEEIKVTVEGYKSSIFDVKAVDEDGDSYTFWDIDVATTDITVTLDDLDDSDTSDGFDGYIEVTNDTGYDIYYLYVSHEDSDDWEEDVLGDEILESGDSKRINISGYSSSVFDVRAEDEDGDTYTIYGIDVEFDDLNLTLDHLDERSEAGTGFSGYIEVTNRTGNDLYYLYVSHEDTSDWEEDVLGDDILSNGDSFKVTLNNYTSSIFDVRAEDEDGETYTVYSIDVELDDLRLTRKNRD